MSRKVLFVLPQPFFVPRGSSIRVMEFVKCLGVLGFDVDVLAQPFGTEVAEDRLRILRAPKIRFVKEVPVGFSWQKALSDFPLALRALRLIKTEDYCVVHGVEEAGFIAAMIARRAKIPFVFNMHSEVSDFGNNIFTRIACIPWRLMERWIVRRASAVTTSSNRSADKVRKFAKNVPIFSLPDLPLASTKEVSVDGVLRIIEEFNLRDKRIISYAGGFGKHQGIELLIESFESLLSMLEENDIDPNDGEVVLLLIGDMGRAERALKTKIRKLGISNQVICIGARSPSEIGAFFAVSDVLVSTRVMGGIPSKIYSYLSSGQIIVATKLRCHQEVLEGTGAILTEPDPDAFARGMVEALKNTRKSRILKAAFAERSRKLIDTKFSEETFAKTIESLYSSLGILPVTALPKDMFATG